jgi:nucleoside diphosphate kinase
MSNEATLESGLVSACLIVKPHAAQQLQQIVAMLPKSCFIAPASTEMGQLTKEQVTEFYAAHVGKWFFPRLIDSMTEGHCYIMRVQAPSIAVLREWVGPTDPAEARKSAPNSVRALYGTALPSNAVHVSDSVEEGMRELRVMGIEFES